MARLKRLLVGGLCCVVILSACRAFSQTRFVFGTVTSDFGKAISDTEINISTGQSDRTTDTGRFRFPVPPLKVGFPYTFQVPSWVIVDPCTLARGRTYLPAPEAEPISIRVLRPRSKEALSANSLACLVEEKFSRFSGRFGSNRKHRFENKLLCSADEAGFPSAFQRRTNRSALNVLGVICSKGPFTENDRTADESFWNSQARSLGFTLEQVETAINDWTNSVTDPYQAGLAALYRNDYHLASKYISSSLDSDMEPNTDVSAVPHAERFVLLARAEFEQANYDAAESALRTFLHIHPNDELVQKNLDLVQADEKEEEKLFDLSGNWTGFTEGDKQKYPLKIHIDKEESRSSIRKRTAFSALVNGIQCRGDLDKRWWDKRWWDIERLREVPVTLTCGNLGYDFEGVIKDSGTDRVMTGTVSRGNQPKLRFYVERER